MIHKFLEQCLGEWESFRTYIYPNNKVLSIQSIMIIEELTENKIQITWKSYYLNTLDEYSKGNMILEFDVDNSKIYRDKGYFTLEPTTSTILDLQNDYLKTQTKYNGKKYIEEINIYSIGDNLYRRRFTRAYDSSGNNMLIGSYLERKL